MSPRKSLTVRKEIFASGRASLHFKIHRLTIARGTLRGIRISIQSMAGKIGQPEGDARAHQLGLRWEADPPADSPAPGAPFRERLAAARWNARHLSGTFHLPEPLTADSAPISFGFTIDELNADAMRYRNAAAGEHLEIALLAYDGEARVLRVVDGAVNGEGEVDQEFWDFELPFGLGLAGAAFKAVGEMYVRAKDGPKPALSSFLHVPGEPEDKVALLISVALHHSGLETYELGRSMRGS